MNQPKPSDKIPDASYLFESKPSEKMPPRLVVQFHGNQVHARIPFGENGAGNYLSREEHTHLLAEKDKRIEELENGCKELIAERHPAAFKEWATAQVTMENTELQKRIEALEAALRFYAEGGGSLNSDYSCVNCDNTKELQVISGHKAREALAASAKGE